MRDQTFLRNQRIALAVAHPGHELRVYGWLESAKPLVFVLTDGSGHAGVSRLGSTTALLESVGARPGSIYGRFTDQQLYAALLAHNLDLFTDLAKELGKALVDERIDCVVGDAVDGYNPNHDMCRMVTNAAVAVASVQSGRSIANYDFPLIGRPDVCPDELRGHAIWVTLDDKALERKLAAAHAYRELADEVRTTLGAHGAEPFRIECLRPVVSTGEADRAVHEYERYGEQRVASHIYQDVVRYREHVLPVAHALQGIVSSVSQ